MRKKEEKRELKGGPHMEEIELETPTGYIEVTEIQKYLDIGENKARELINNINFPKLKIGPLIRIPRKVFFEFIESPERLIAFNKANLKEKEVSYEEQP